MKSNYRSEQAGGYGLSFGLCVVCTGLLLSLGAASAWAQATSTGTVSGQVTDQKNALIPGVDVNLLDVATNAPRVSVTNDAGRYTFVNVSPGTYDLSFSLKGFKTVKVSAQQVTVGRELTINATLTIGAITETVEVLAAGTAELQTSTATIGTTLGTAFLDLLPNLGRDATTLATLQVAVTPSGQVAGVQNDQSQMQLDGGNNTDDVSGTQSTYVTSYSSGGQPTGAVPTPVESIEEFKVGTVLQTADFNGSAGSQIQMVTKRGTNQLHGSLYQYYYGSDVGAANTWARNHTKSGSLPYTPIPSTHYNRFGAAAGGPVLPEWLGGKTYLFGNYEGYRFPNVTTVTRNVPTALMRAGVIQVPNGSGVYQQYNLNPYPVTVNGITYQPATCGSAGAFCDPRGIGLNPVISQIWSKFMPMPNDPQSGDRYNTQGFQSSIRLPQSSDFFAGRLDHDFGVNWRFMASYRYYSFSSLNNAQVDIGGALPGDTLGQAVAKAERPQYASYLVAGLTTTISPHLTNDFRWNYLRNWWQWASAAGQPQLPGLGGALEIGGESTNALIPYNVNTQNVRQRIWNAHNLMARDDLTWLRGDHLLQFGASYQRNFDYHQRNDNGVGIMASVVYQVTGGAGITMPAAYQPSGLPASQLSNWSNLYAQVLGLVSQPQVMYTRSGSDLVLQPLGTFLFGENVIPSYNVYFNDIWHFRPSLTFTYGLGYNLSMPPYEEGGKQVEAVDAQGNEITTEDYLAERRTAALAGQVYNPAIGFANVPNVGSGRKYPYKPFYGGFSPRLAIAWNPTFGGGFLSRIFGHNDSVIRAGYSRLYGRLNGVDIVMIPLMGIGLGQAVSCIGASSAGQCLGASGADPATAFRIGADGMSAPLPAISQKLPQPYYPGVGGNAAAGDASALDPKGWGPSRSHEFSLTLQRAISKKVMIEAGYIGRIIRNEYELINLDAVPYMMTLNGQRFDNAFANLYTQMSAGQTVQTQPFFEAAMGGPASAYCSKFASCTAAVAANMKSQILSTQVYTLWSTLSKQSSWTLGRTMPSSGPAQLASLFMYDSNGFGNYNAGFFSFAVQNWRGLGARSNFTWSHALGTGGVAQSNNGWTLPDAWDLRTNYGNQRFDIRFMYNLSMIYQPPVLTGRNGLVGHLLKGWSFAPLFTAQSGSPLRVTSGSGCQSFGEINCSSGSADESAVMTKSYAGGNSAYYNVTVPSGAGINGNPSTGGSGINMFADPNAVYAGFRRLILGLDHNAGAAGTLRGLPSWNLDMTISKDFRATEKFGAALTFQFTNVLNHFQPGNPSLNIDSPQSFGVINSQANTPRQIQFGLRIRF